MAESASTAEPKTFKGSCHCKAVQYEVKLALPDPPVGSRCNCTICVKSGFTGLHMKPEDFTLITPGSLEEIADYQVRSKDVHHRFCNKCGSQIAGYGFYEFNGKRTDFFSLNILTLDQPQEGLDLSKFKIMYCDGLNNNWAAGMKDVPCSGGAP